MIEYFLCILVIPFLSCLFLYYPLKKKDIANVVLNMYFSTMFLNILFILITGYSILNVDFNLNFYILYIIGSFLLINFYYTCSEIKTKIKVPIYKIITIVIGVLFTTLLIYFCWLLGDSGRMTFELFMYNAKNPVNSETADFFTTISAMIFFISLMNTFFVYGILNNNSIIFIKFKNWKKTDKTIKRIAILIPSILLLFSIALPFYTFHLEQAYAYFYSDSTFIEEHYVNPNDVEITWPEKKQNLVYIFVESFESSYFSKELGGMDNQNLLPNLTKLMSEGVHFSDKDDFFGGAVTMPQANVTISGMVSSLSGINYKIPAGVKAGDLANTLPGVTTLTDLLKNQGYQQYFTIGTYVDSYSMGPFYRQHGNAKTVGLDEKIAIGDLPSGYKVWWGFEDSKLYEFVKKDLLTISKYEEPFIYTFVTNDTHRNEGYLDKTCNYNNKFPMQNAIMCTDQMLSDFLKWLMNQSFYNDTTVVIVGDHIGHEEEYVNSLSPQEDRRIFNLILNAQNDVSLNKIKPRQFWAGDMFPTVLYALGVEIEGEQLGLGTNLFSESQTLIEKYGVDFVRESLEKNSNFYNNNFLNK